MNKLPPSASSLLAQARAVDREHRVDVERSLAALTASLPFADAAPQASFEPELLQSGLPSGAPSAIGVGQGASVLVAGKTLKLVLATVALGGALGGGAWIGLTPAARTAAPVSAPAVRVAERGSQHATPTAAAEPVVPIAAEPALRAGQPVAAAAPARSRRSQAAPSAAANQAARPTVVSAEPATSAGQASEQSRQGSGATEPAPLPAPPVELDLIDNALTSLRAGAAQAALTQLEQHERHYARGTFAVERRGLRVLALCQLGQNEQAQRERAGFLAKHPSAPIAARVRQACGPEGER